jgi:hypothetical protein
MAPGDKKSKNVGDGFGDPFRPIPKIISHLTDL